MKSKIAHPFKVELSNKRYDFTIKIIVKEDINIDKQWLAKKDGSKDIDCIKEWIKIWVYESMPNKLNEFGSRPKYSRYCGIDKLILKKLEASPRPPDIPIFIFIIAIAVLNNIAKT